MQLTSWMIVSLMDGGSRSLMTAPRRESQAEAAPGQGGQDPGLGQEADAEDQDQDLTGRVAQEAGQDPREMTVPRKTDPEASLAPRAGTSQGAGLEMRRKDLEAGPRVDPTETER